VIPLALACGEDSVATPPSASAVPTGLSPIEGFDGLLRGTADCQFDAKGNVDAACPGAAALGDWNRRHQSWMEQHNDQAAEVARRYLGDRSPAIRSVVFQMLAWRIKRNDAAARADVVKGAQQEKHPGVMKAIVEAASKDASAVEMQGVLVSALDNSADLVRKAAINGLVPASHDKAPIARVLEVVEKDPSPALRALVCQRLQPYSDPHVKATFDRVFTSPETEATVFDGCFFGLVLNWASRSGAAPDRQAYERTFELLEKGPRDARHRYGLGLSAMSSAASERPGDKAYEAWFEQAKVFLVRERVLAVIKLVLLDLKASDDNRSDAYFSLVGLGVAPSDMGLSAEDMERLSNPRAQPAAP